MQGSSGGFRNRSSRDVERLLRSFGFELVRRRRHDIYEGYREGTLRAVTVPRNKASIPPKTLLTILAQAGITKDEAREFWA